MATHPLASQPAVPNLVRASAVLACLCGLACSSDGRERRDAGAAPDAMADPDAGQPSSILATATAQFERVAGAVVDDDAGPVLGTAKFRATPIGVDLEASFSGCTGMRTHSLEILDAGDCSEQSLSAPIWDEGRGGGIPGVLCTGQSGLGLLGYARTSRSAATWSIGGPEDSNLVGRILVVRDPRTAAALACGVITRGEDAQRVALPVPDVAPRAEVLAALTGLCQFRQFANAGPTCPDTSALVECGDVHCQLGRCAQQCGDYTACLDGASGDVCSPALSCPQSAECSQCQNEAMSCMLGFCPEHINCSPPLTPDGPCSRLESCCALQGENAEACLMVVQTIIAFGGDANCIGSMNDWDFLAHQHVPCRFGQ